MAHPKIQRRTRIICGVVLIVVGIIVAFLLIKHQYDDCTFRWLNNYDGFAQKYTSVWDCFWDRSKWAILISIVLGLIPVGFGSYLCKYR